jgi:hypothetical protein
MVNIYCLIEHKVNFLGLSFIIKDQFTTHVTTLRWLIFKLDVFIDNSNIISMLLSYYQVILLVTKNIKKYNKLKEMVW